MPYTDLPDDFLDELEFAMLDVISGGRQIAGFPVGTPMDTWFAYGQNPSTLCARFAAQPGYTREATIRARVTSQVAAAANQTAALGGVATEWKEIVDEGRRRGDPSPPLTRTPLTGSRRRR